MRMCGSSCTFSSLQEVFDELKINLDEDESEITLQAKEMAEEDFKKLPEFQGW